MTDAEEKVLGIKHLPIFPLPVVMLPFELMPLHIFEDRYRQMIKDIELSKNIFGLSYFNTQESVIEKPLTGSVGCAVEVREVQPLPDGRSNILTIGVMRYRLIDYIETGEPYLVADIEFFRDEKEDESRLNPLADEVFELFKRIAKAAHKLSGQRGEFPDIPQAQPEQLSFLVAAAFNLEADIKYQLLEMRSTIERLERLKEILDKVVEKVEESARVQKIAQGNGHAGKKIDL